MVITFGLLTVIVLASAIAGACVGAWIVALFSASQVNSLQSQVNAKAEFWCDSCHHAKRSRELAETLTARESYVRTLEERIDRQRRSINALGGNLQKRTLRIV